MQRWTGLRLGSWVINEAALAVTAAPLARQTHTHIPWDCESLTLKLTTMTTVVKHVAPAFQNVSITPVFGMELSKK